jgi:hypothetical protein
MPFSFIIVINVLLRFARIAVPKMAKNGDKSDFQIQFIFQKT